MFTLLFKRHTSTHPEIMGATHVSHAELLASSPSIAWVQIISSDGKVMLDGEESLQRIRSSMFGKVIEPITSEHAS